MCSCSNRPNKTQTPRGTLRAVATPRPANTNVTPQLGMVAMPLPSVANEVDRRRIKKLRENAITKSLGKLT